MGKWLGPPHEQIPRCGAKTRAGHPCGQYAMKNGRCYFHGGKSTGPRTTEGREKAHKANLKHGQYTSQAIAERHVFRLLLNEALDLIEVVETNNAGKNFSSP